METLRGLCDPAGLGRVEREANLALLPTLPADAKRQPVPSARILAPCYGTVK
jgi:hypothetical protein